MIAHVGDDLTMQVKLKNLALCIIDEISIVGVSTFGKICSALKNIKQSTDNWGGVSILAVDNFFPTSSSWSINFLSTLLKYAFLVILPLYYGTVFSVIIFLRSCMREIEFATSLNFIRMNVLEKRSPEDVLIQFRKNYIYHVMGMIILEIIPESVYL